MIKLPVVTRSQSFRVKMLSRWLLVFTILRAQIDAAVHSGKVWGVMWTLSFPGDFSFDLPYKASTACNNQEICVRV